MSVNKIVNAFSKTKEILVKKRFLKVFILSSLISFIVLYLLMVATNSYNLFLFMEMNGTLFAIASLITSAIISMLFGVYASLSLYKFEYMQKLNGQNAATSTGGFLVGLFSAGCPSCGAILLPLIGISSLAVFPFGGLELKVLSIGLLGFVNVKMTQNLDTCITKKPKQMLKPIISNTYDKAVYASVLIIAGLIIFNQFQITDLSTTIDYKLLSLKSNGSGDDLDLSNVDISQINSTQMAIAMLFPVNDIQNEEDAIEIMLSAGTPEYSENLGGITFDDPVTSMEYLVKWYPTLKEDVKQNDPESWNRYLSIAAAPRGVSCEFCCGIGPQGVDAEGNSKCGCKHNPALQALALGLIQGTDYNDAEVLKEIMRWKAMFFPQKMVGIAIEVADADISQLQELPGMVGGC